MKRTIPALALLALLATACTPETNAAPSTVTRTVTNSADPTTGAKTGNAKEEPRDPRPCTWMHVEAAVAPGESPNPETWQTAVVVTNLGPDACSLEGASELRFSAADGSPLEIQQVMSGDGPPAERVVLAVGEQAAMGVLVSTSFEPAPPSDCLVGGATVDVILPGDEEPATAEASLPPVCGAVQVHPWAAGGAPGVAPN